MIMQPCKLKKSQLRAESYHSKDKRADLKVKPRTEQERVQNQQTREPRRSNGGVARQGFILLIQELFGEPNYALDFLLSCPALRDPEMGNVAFEGVKAKFNTT